TFKDGRITDVRADGGADALIRTQIATDPGAPYLGEIALVDKESRVGKAGIIFWNTLYDENATCHMAFGHGFDFTVPDQKDREAGQQHRPGNLLADALCPRIWRRGVVARADQEDWWRAPDCQWRERPRQLWPESTVDAVPFLPRTKEGRRLED